MADISAMEIYGELPQTDCGDCDFPTCMAFAMQLASKQVELDQCPHVSEEAKETLAASSAPPMKIVTIGEGEQEVEIGGETVQFRHEEKFHRPAGICIRLEDSLGKEQLDKNIDRINNLTFERIGEVIEIDLIEIVNSQLSPSEFGELAGKIDEDSSYPVILVSEDPTAIEKGLEHITTDRPLIGNANVDNWESMAELAVENDLPLIVENESLQKLSQLTEKITDKGQEDLILKPSCNNLNDCLKKLTQLRRFAVSEEFGPLGFPSMASADSGNPDQLVMEGAGHILKFASMVSIDTSKPWQILPLLTVRQHIYIDPQVQNSVEAKLYEVGDPGPDAPVLFTTNFQLTYYSLEGAVEDSGYSAYISVADTEGLGILNAYADDQLSGEIVTETVSEQEVMKKVNHNKLIIPGLVAMLRMSIQEEGGWDVIVGPEDAASLPRFLREEWKE